MNNKVFAVGTKVVTTKPIVFELGNYPTGSKGTIVFMNMDVVMVEFEKPYIAYPCHGKLMFSPAEFINYFKLYEKKQWTDWKIYDEVIGWQDDRYFVSYRHNEKRIQAKIKHHDKVLRTVTTCCDGDEFDLEFGLQLALTRLAAKLMEHEAEVLVNKKYPR